MDGQLAVSLQTGIDLPGHVYRQPDRSSLIDQGPFYILTNPPGGIGGEAEAALRVKFFHSPDQAEIAFLNDVQKGQPPVTVASRERHHQSQIAFNHLFTSGRIALTGLTSIGLFLFGTERLGFGQIIEIETGHIEARAAGFSRDRRILQLFKGELVSLVGQGLKCFCNLNQSGIVGKFLRACFYAGHVRKIEC